MLWQRADLFLMLLVHLVERATARSPRTKKGRIAPRPKFPHAYEKVCIPRAFDAHENGRHDNCYWASSCVLRALCMAIKMTPLLRLSGAVPDSQSSDGIHVTCF